MSSQPINQYGDTLIPTTGRHGVNISEQRVDELDQGCLDFVRTLAPESQVIDIGGGSGAQSKRIAELGASVLMVDLTDQAEAIMKFNNALGRQAIRFMRRDVREIKVDDWPQTVCCVYSQRMLSFLPYADALQLLVTLRDRAVPCAQFFISVGGLDTELGVDYPDADKPVEGRFERLSPAAAKKCEIYSHQCLYRANDLKQLAEAAGLPVVKLWSSAFGNIKLIASVKIE